MGYGPVCSPIVFYSKSDARSLRMTHYRLFLTGTFSSEQFSRRTIYGNSSPQDDTDRLVVRIGLEESIHFQQPPQRHGTINTRYR